MSLGFGIYTKVVSKQLVAVGEQTKSKTDFLGQGGLPIFYGIDVQTAICLLR